MCSRISVLLCAVLDPSAMEKQVSEQMAQRHAVSLLCLAIAISRLFWSSHC